MLSSEFSHSGCVSAERVSFLQGVDVSPQFDCSSGLIRNESFDPLGDVGGVYGAATCV